MPAYIAPRKAKMYSGELFASTATRSPGVVICASRTATALMRVLTSARVYSRTVPSRSAEWSWNRSRVPSTSPSARAAW